MTYKCDHGVDLAKPCRECRGIMAVDPVPALAPLDAILDERGKRYGKFTGHSALTQQLKRVMKQHRKANHGPPAWRALADDQRESLEMIQHKVGRILNGDADHIDSWDDIAGYAKLVADRLRGVVER